MVKVECTEGKTHIEMDGGTSDLIAKSLCIVKAMYSSIGSFTNKANEKDTEYGKRAQERFKDFIINHPDDVFKNEVEEEEDDLLSELEKALLELQKLIEARK